jgi:trimethylamine---corrinoid protein Co-methyltransferase
MTATPTRLVTLGHRPATDLLDATELDRVHEASLDVLARSGVQIRSHRLRRLLGDSDAVIDDAKGIVRFPESMIDAALAAAPRRFLMAGRDPAVDLDLDRSCGYFSVEGGLSEIVDLDTGMRRPAVRDDFVGATRLADALDEIAFLWPCTALSDVPPDDQAVHQTYLQLANSCKHIVAMTTYTARDARAVVEMGSVVAGSREALRARPVVSGFVCSISPLIWDGEPLEAALVFAAAGLPCGVVTMPVATAGAPTTTAGQLVVANAELLSGITILETLYPGTPVYYTPFSAAMDLQTGGIDAAWGPEAVLFNLASAQLGRRYGLPVNIGTGGTGAKTQDWQAGVQHTLMMLSVLQAGDIDLVACTGGVDNSRVFSHEQVLLDCELWSIAARLLEGIPTSDEHLAVSVIDAVGPGGHFLGERHTLRHMRSGWRARFFGRETWEAWEEAGRPEPRHRATTYARDLITRHEPLALADDVDRELRTILASSTSQEACP